MKKLHKKRIERTLSAILAATMSLSFFTAIPVSAEIGKKTYNYDGYSVDYNVTNEWDGAQTVELTVSNTGTDPILNWALKYDADGEISNLWNADLHEQNGDLCIIKNLGWNFEIAPSQSITYGYTLSGNNLGLPDNFEICSKRVDKSEGYDVQYNITKSWDVGVEGNIVITNTSAAPIEAWTLSFDSNFTIDNLWDGRVLENNETSYTIAAEMWTNPIQPDSSMTIGFVGTKAADVEAVLNNFKLTEVIIDEIGEVTPDWEDKTDTDGDGLPDVYEKYAYDTDPKNPDTDGDRLPDGYEVITLHTNPSLTDTDSNGITDDMEDFDSDNLTNYEEYVLGTDPFSADTDEDGLSDGDEVNIYNTDPLNPDSDGDGVLDGDEVDFGLDPTNPTDGGTTFEQTLSESDLSVNKYNNEFQISLSLDASNNVKRYIRQDISDYWGMLSDNNSIIGMPVCIEYNAGTVASGTITFRLDKNFVDNNTHYYPELNLGMERYGIFVYDDEVGTIIPIECSYDEGNYSITISAENMGNLMIIDNESLIFDLGLMSETESYTYNVPSVAAYSLNAEVTENAITNTDESVNEVTDYDDLSLEEIEAIINGDYGVSTYSIFDKEPNSAAVMGQVDLVLVVDTTGSMGSQIATVKSNVSGLISRLRENDISLYVSVVDYRDITCDGVNSTKVNNNSGRDFNNLVPDIAEALMSLTPDGGGDFEESAIDGLGMAYNLKYRNNAKKFIFLITDATYKTENRFGIKNMSEMSDMLKDKGIYTSVVTSSSYYSAYSDMVTATDGTYISMYNNFCDDMYDFICSKVETQYRVIIGSSLVTGQFNEELKKDGPCDTDGDNLSDSDEINWKRIRINSDGSYTFPTWGELSNKSGYKIDENNLTYKLLKDRFVIPALSNPFSKDTDKDYYPDNIDEEKTTANPMYIYDKGLDDSEFHKGIPIPDRTPDKFTDGILLTKNDLDKNEYYARYSFKREKGRFCEFVLKPEYNSFYKFTSNASIFNDVSVYYKKGPFKEIVFVNQEEDGTYLLDAGKEYIIKVLGQGSSEYEFTVEQDNWAYAPNGGIRTPIKYSFGTIATNNAEYGAMFLPTEKLLSSIQNFKNGISVTIDLNSDIDTQINNILDETGMIVTEEEYKSAKEAIIGAASTAGGDILSVVLIFIPIVGEGKKASVVVAVVTAIKNGFDFGSKIITYKAVPSAIGTIEDYYEQCNFKNAYRNGYANVYVIKTMGYLTPDRIWASWTNSPYIYKFTKTGDACTVDKNPTEQQVIEWCGWTPRVPAE